MNRKNFVTMPFVVVAVILIGIVGYFVVVKKSLAPPQSNETPNGEKIYCTQDAKLCLDGSYVGRVSPSCEFATCPGPKEISSFMVPLGTEFTLKKNQVAKIDNTGLEVQIIQFYNNPCPAEVQCVWSGVGIGFKYRFNGEVREGINLVQAFGYQTNIVKTDHETYTNLVVEKMK